MYNNVTFLCHHGTKGQKWGQRRFQNSDGSLTAEGRLHYGVGKARDGIGKVGAAIRKKVKPTESDLLEEYDKAAAKQRKKDIKQATKELKGKKKKLDDMDDYEIDAQYNRLRKEQAIREMEKQNSKAYKAAQGAKMVGRGTAKGVAMTAKGTAWTLKTVGKVAKPLAGLAGDLAMRGLRNAGNNWVDSLTMSDADRAKQKSDISKNLLEALKNDQERKRRGTDDFKFNLAAEDKIKAAQNKYELDRIESGQARTSKFLKDAAEDAKNQASIARDLKKAFTENDEEKKTVFDFVKEQQAIRDIALAKEQTRAAKGYEPSLDRVTRYTKANKGK